MGSPAHSHPSPEASGLGRLLALPGSQTHGREQSGAKLKGAGPGQSQPEVTRGGWRRRAYRPAEELALDAGLLGRSVHCSPMLALHDQVLGTPARRGCFRRWLDFSDQNPQALHCWGAPESLLSLLWKGFWNLGQPLWVWARRSSKGDPRPCLGPRAPIVRSSGQRDSKTLRPRAPVTPTLRTATAVVLHQGVPG